MDNYKNVESYQKVECNLETIISDKLINIEGGKFIMGTDDEEGFPDDGEGPAREEIVDPFYIDKYAVTNEEFSAFVKETGYQTEAEKFGWSFVFEALIKDKFHPSVKKVPGLSWWYAVLG